MTRPDRTLCALTALCLGLGVTLSANAQAPQTPETGLQLEESLLHLSLEQAIERSILAGTDGSASPPADLDSEEARFALQLVQEWAATVMAPVVEEARRMLEAIEAAESDAGAATAYGLPYEEWPLEWKVEGLDPATAGDLSTAFYDVRHEWKVSEMDGKGSDVLPTSEADAPDFLLDKTR